MSIIQVQLPDSVLNQAKELADTNHIPLDKFVALAVEERVSALRRFAYLQERGKRGDREKFLAILDKAPDVPPIPGDELGD